MNTMGKTKIISGAVLSIVMALSIFSCIQGETTVAASDVVNKSDAKYSYSDMQKDILALCKKYPDRIRVSTLAKTADKRNIYCLCMGDPGAKKQIVVTAGVHAREYINCQIAMALAERYCRKYYTGSYKGKKYSDLFSNTAVYILPMVNPDGVTISQYGPKKIKDKKLRAKIRKTKRIGSYKNWKANARAVDINRNFSSGFGKGSTRHHRCSENYCGKKANSECETRAVISRIKKCSNCSAVINLHSMGKLVYWGYTGKRKSPELKLKSMVLSTTKYSSEEETGKGCGDMEHYLRNKAKKVYVCIENGIGKVPVSHKQFSGIYKKNYKLIEKASYIFR
ncbi:MAG: M14 family zinc carboxypeptidase [Eubacteriaceae bacterium]|nr:M14 family zinc carboxypeptidase [Eubacteriaceae bacterium]